MIKRALLCVCVFSAFLTGVVSAQNNKPLRYSLPYRKGALQLQLGELQLKQASFRPDGSGVRILAEDGKGLVMTLFVQHAEKPGDSKVCRQEWWSGTRKGIESKMKIADLKIYESGQTSIAEYRVPEWQGVPVNQKSLHAYFAGGDLWAEIHLSRTPFRSGDEALFTALLENARMDPDYIPGSMDYFVFGSLRYHEQDYKRAAEYYQRALDIEKQGAKLEPKYWKVLVDNLGMSYGLSRDLKRSKEVFEYGISQEATYPLFYYNLACTYAEMGDLDNAIANLRKAFEFKRNMLPGEKMPDPMKDDSFRQYTRDPKFVAAVDKLPRS